MLSRRLVLVVSGIHPAPLQLRMAVMVTTSNLLRDSERPVHGHAHQGWINLHASKPSHHGQRSKCDGELQHGCAGGSGATVNLTGAATAS
jgi:hypothetical protein